MNSLDTDIDWIVREVVRRLTLPSDGGSATVPPTDRGAPNPHRLVVKDRVVTLAGLNGRLQDVKQLVVAPRAIVTPAVRDELKRRSIELVREQAAGNSTKIKSGVVLMVDGDESIAALADCPSLAREQRGDLRQLVSDLPSVLRQRQPVVLLTSKTAVASIAANRHRGVRAISVRDDGRSLADIDSTAANVVVANSHDFDRVKLNDLIEQLARRGWRDCPPGLHTILD